MLTLVLPVRNWPTERVEACIDSFVALGAPSLTEIVVVDFGSEEPIVLRDGMHPMVKTLRIEAKVWSLSEAINAGTLAASNDLIAKTDADILISRSSTAEFERMVADLSEGRIGLGVCQATDLHQSISVQEALSTVVAGNLPMGRLRAKWGQGGLVFFSRPYWNELGGFESRFTGWGNEDNDFAERVRGSGRLIKWADPEHLQILHMWHPPSHSATGILAQRQKNQKIAATDKSILRPIVFRHSDFPKNAAPEVMKQVRPLVTIGIATTARPNREGMIREAIDSFKGQIDQDFEIMVVDNGSSTDEVETLRASLGKIRWAKDLIRLETADRPSIPGARNMITEASRGRYICVMDDDDIAFSTRLADHLRNFEQNGRVHGSHGGWIDFDEATGAFERNPGKVRNAATLLKGTGKITAHPGSFYRRDVMQAVPYDEAFALGSDLDLALRMSLMGFEIAHTGSYVTMRRYHSSNVTITGTANQASNGQTARTRALHIFGWSKEDALKAEAQSTDKDVYCRNQLSFDSVIEKIPGYVGEWQIYVPLDVIQAKSLTVAETSIAQPDEHAVIAAPQGMNALTTTDLEFVASQSIEIEEHRNILVELLAISEGDVCTRTAGLNQPIYFRSAPIKTLRKAKKVKAEIEALLGIPCTMNSVKQGEIDRAVPFNWNALELQSGERALRSEATDDLATIMAFMNAIPAGSVMREQIGIVSDYIEEGPSYCLVSPSIKGYDAIRDAQFQLQQQTGIAFNQITNTGEHCELTTNSRVH